LKIAAPEIFFLLQTSHLGELRPTKHTRCYSNINTPSLSKS